MAYETANETVGKYTTPQERADDLTAAYSTPPIPVLEIAEGCGVNVIFKDFGKHNETVAGFCDFKNARLFVNINDTQTRQLFTIAHELGHWLLHKDVFVKDPSAYPILPRFQRVEISNRFEREANAFAAHLLVPSRLLAPVRHYPVSALASTFGVSKSMMEIRLKNG